MKGFVRKNLIFSLCGLNCGLCPMHLDHYCPGCGGGEGNQSCKIARCSLDHDGVEYCFECEKFPCEIYEGIDKVDSFITHRNQIKDLLKMNEIGEQTYNLEQLEKIEILKDLLEQYNDGRKKTFFCVAVNLLKLQDLKEVMNDIKNEVELTTLSKKEKAAIAVYRLKKIASQEGIEIKLNKKKK